MTDANHEFLETADIVSAFVPVDLSAAANNGSWVSMSDYQKCVAVLFAAAGTAGDNPAFTLKQATDASGAGAKSLAFTRVREKVGTLSSVGTWNVVTQAAANTYTNANSAASQKIIAVEINGSDLDGANGFDHVQLSIPDVGANAQLGCAFYVLLAPRHPQSIPASALA